MDFVGVPHVHAQAILPLVARLIHLQAWIIARAEPARLHVARKTPAMADVGLGEVLGVSVSVHHHPGAALDVVGPCVLVLRAKVPMRVDGAHAIAGEAGRDGI